MHAKRYALPFVLPVAAFAGAIALGAALLALEPSAAGQPVSLVDALFTATSSVCVTGLASVDPSTAFSPFGQTVMMVLIQLGGLGITTYSSLIFYLWSRRVSLTNRLAVGETLFNDPSFHLGRFLQRIVLVVFLLELAGALALLCLEPEAISPFQALFLSVSAFCNAGFALWPDNLMAWRSSWGVCLVVMTLIVLGGLGVAVIDECLLLLKGRLRALFAGPKGRGRLPGQGAAPRAARLSFRSRLVLSTSFFLICAGALLLLLPEYFANDRDISSLPELVLPSLFQSVTARTAGFNSVNIAGLTDISLLTLILLMIIGGSPGSCAGGIKTTSFRVLVGFIAAQLKGRRQVVVAGRGMDWQTLNRVFVLITFAGLTIAAGTFALAYSEGAAAPHGETPFQALDLFFEAVSAFATVGLSTGVTPQLSATGKIIDCLLMFIGRLGPVWLVTTLQQFQTEPRYLYADAELPVG